MSWISNLYRTYKIARDVTSDSNLSIGEGEKKLLPIYHNQQNAQITVVLNQQSEFVRAESVLKEDAGTPVPITEKSGIRTSAPIPHPLHDNLMYVAGDLNRYFDIKKRDIHNDFFEPYMEQLEQWATHADSLDYIDMVYQYLKKETLVSDLLQSQVLTLSEEGKLDTKAKIQNIASEKSFVRFAVEVDGFRVNLWEDKDTAENYISYFDEKNKNKKSGLCYVTGEEKILAVNHGKYIRYPGDGAKLISSNDSSGFTFRGRFLDAGEGTGVSYEVSEKAHAALRWLIRRQGYIRDGFTVLSWSNEMREIPDLTLDSEDVFPFGSGDDTGSPPKVIDSGNAFAEELKQTIKGWQKKLYPDDTINIMELDAATPGRLSVLYYRELQSYDYLQRLEYWHRSGAWLHYYKRDQSNQWYSFVGVPTLRDIIIYSLGHEIESLMQADDKLIKIGFQRLIPCVIDYARIPKDVVESAYRRACAPQKMTDFNWMKTVSITCGLIRKYYMETKKEEWDMALDENCKNRSYLFGRLLAVANQAERLSYYQSQKEARTTVAMRYMDAYAKRPFRTWNTIEIGLQPYWNRLKAGSRNWYQKELDDIMSLFEPGDFSSREQLDARFLLGFHCQSNKYRKKNEEEQIGEEEEAMQDGSDSL